MRLGLSFLRSILAAAVLAIINRPPAPHHSRVDFAGFGAANSDNPAVAVLVPLAALDMAPARQLSHNRGGVPATGVSLTRAPLAALLPFWCVDAPQANPLAGKLNGVAVDNSRLT